MVATKKPKYECNDEDEDGCWLTIEVKNDDEGGVRITGCWYYGP